MRDEKESARKELTRRGFLKGLGAGAVVATGASTLGSTVFAASPAEKVPPKWTQEADVVVVGFGGAGAATAWEAEKAGAKVIILEKMAKEGGSTHLCAGVVLGAGTSLQKAEGIEDSPEGLYQFLMAVGGEYVDSDLIKTLAAEAGQNIEWLLGLGAEFPIIYASGVEHVPKYAAITPPKARGHITKGGGAMLFAVLREAVKKRGIKVLRETSALKLIQNPHGEVVGLKVRSHGKEQYIRARKAVVLTSGGFGRNKDMLRAYSPMGYEAVPLGALGSTGDGMRMAQALGADLRGTYPILGVPAAVGKPSALLLYLPVSLSSSSSPCVAVNKEGKRFVNETIEYAITNIKIFQQEDSFVWTIFDEKVRQDKGGLGALRNIIQPNFAEEGLMWSEDMKVEIEKGIVLSGETFGELAAKIKVDRQAFETTMNQYNNNAKMGKDLEFDKTSNLGSIENPPFYAIKTRTGIVENVGGLRIDTKARVRNVFGEVIPRLYAAGCHITGGFVGDIYPASGMGTGVGIAFGRIAGRNAARENKI